VPSLAHEAVLDLFRNRPSLGPELLRDALHTPVPSFDRVRVGDANLTELVPTEFRADLVLLLEAEDGPPQSAIVVEAQRGMDSRKRWSWPVYITNLRARVHCDVALLVLAEDDVVANWAKRPIETGHPGFALTPLVLGPGSVPVVRDEVQAARAPELAVLSAIMHGQEVEAAEIGRAALAAARGLDDDRARLYVDLVLASVHEAARAVLEALMANRNYEYQSDFAKRYVAQGRDEGRSEGKAQALLTVLRARGIEVSPEMQAHILACTDLAVLDGWLARAVAAKSADEVLGG
jgi:hypothetical protein